MNDQLFSIDDVFNPRSPYFSGAAKSVVPASAQNAFEEALDPRRIVGGELIGDTTVSDGFLQSENFATGVSGWKINSNGDAEFQSVTIDGVALTTIGTFGGNGADGALSITSGTTTVSLGSAVIVIKNYTSLSITGTGKLAFSSPHSGGTIIILKSQGGVTLTSSDSALIDASGMGAAGGGNQADGTDPNELLFAVSTTPKGKLSNSGTGGAAGAVYETTAFYSSSEQRLYRKSLFLVPGAGGGGGAGGSLGSGGAGGGVVYIECGGALNFTGTVSVSGANGNVGSNAVGGSDEGSGGGGGGSAGMFVLLYNTLTANTGTITAAGGTGGNSGTSNGSTGANGGGGGAGSQSAAGGAGGSTGAGGSGAAGAGAGGGGGGGRNGVGAGLAGGAGGASVGGLVAQNKFFA